MLSDSALTIHQRLNSDLAFFMENAPLIVKDKSGNLVTFKLNQAQQHIHNCLEKQKRETGMVRALILKGRQEGCSLYMTGRNYHKVSRNRGISALLISHEGKATGNIFEFIKRYQRYIRDVLRPEEGAANRYQLVLSALESSFTAGTAGNEDVGRSGTYQLFHWSEAAYTDNAEAIVDGAMQTVPDVAGTEIVIESTANGPVGVFYEMCQAALHHKGRYQLIFVPWWWMDEYEAVYDNSPLSEEEAGYISINLSGYPKAVALRKIMWRRLKIVEFGSGEKGLRKFRQVYPANPVEAFQSTGIGLIDPIALGKARKNFGLTDDNAPLIAGVDSAGSGEASDRTIIALRRGRVLEDVIKVPKMQNMDMALAGVISNLINTRRLDMVFVDVGYGHGTIDRLHEMGYRTKVMPVAFGEQALRPDVYMNKRSEMIIEAAEWVNNGGVRIPDDDEVHSDFAAMPLDETTSNGLKYIKSKKDIRKVLGKSTDIYDAFALTFAYPVRREIAGGQGGRRTAVRKAQSPLSSLRRLRG